MSEELARQFHEAYERLAPQFSYTTREASAKPWGEVPQNNQLLMIAVTDEIEDRIKQLSNRIEKLEAEKAEKAEKAIRAKLVQALIDATNKLREATLFDEANYWYDKQGEAIAALEKGDE
jgi:uncharacterized small protein (DUF1192 family)